ncbi:hypothetical protein B0T22DRAFT_282969 [Podospora appendiculata]|uniref:BTB domain-containing protein n=1 Tax=Podospora appendiculata TaxID=314037 RepID=A0AAE0X1D7_9PEZI|nr:hypothetical protein B0T22DRAFT_282969 [Podospora appendiculata]
MTHLLWKYYWEDDVDKFRRLLSPASFTGPNTGRSPNIGGYGGSGSPGGFGTSPRPTPRLRKSLGFGASSGNARNGGSGLGRSEVNSRDYTGLTVLLRAASSTAENAVSFVEALLEHPAIDIYIQDPESGWNALHRALYTGNISIARLLLEKERKDLTGHTASVHRVGQLIKTKDHEGNSPFDLYNSSIGERNLRDSVDDEESDDGSGSEEVEAVQGSTPSLAGLGALGEDLYAFGSNRNLCLGFGDQDDRQFPERVYLNRPDHLLRRFYTEYLEDAGLEGPTSHDLAKIPTLVLNRPLVFQDVVLSKFHSAVLTTDPVSNLYVCGIGRGGRLGLGDENTRFTFTAVGGLLADRKVVQVALGQNHSMALDDNGALWTWGNNAQCQLGYALPPTKQDEDPINTTPRQVFGPLKKEVILGIAASSIHSVAHTGTSLYCWGKNIGQLALMDADSRSLESQQIPRKVAASLFSSPIVMVTAIDKATTILLQNHTVCVFTAYGYNIVKFPFDGLDAIGNLSMSGRYEPGRSRIQYITSGGETIAALTGRGDLFTLNLDHKIEANPPATSTTNPSKIKGAVTQPQCIWSARKDGVRSVGVGEHEVIISTHSGAVWQRIQRVKAKDASSGPLESKRKDFKFQRVPCITKVSIVRASPSGGFAAIRQDSDVMKDQITIDEQSLWDDVAQLSCLEGFQASEPRNQSEDPLKSWNSDTLKTRLGSVAYEVLKSPEVEEDLSRHLTSWAYRYESPKITVCTSASPNLRIPIHSWLLSARSSVLRNALAQFRKTGSYVSPDAAFTVEAVDGKTVVCFQGLDLISLLNLVHFMHEDKVIPAWNFTRQTPLAYRYRQIRLEVMKLATRLNMSNLEAAARLQTEPKKCMHEDFRHARKERRFFEDSDALLELDGAEVPIHSAFICQRCPWFEGLFHGRSSGMWLSGRRAANDLGSGSSDVIKIDLSHMDPGAFDYVLRYLYGDFGAELFDGAVCESFEDFLDLVMEVMSISNYLMLDRLSQICQHVMGRFANIRNIAHLLNAISPCSITEFKDAGLEYVCLQLESMLENHLLDELDEDLLLQLDEVVRDNQAAQFPFSKSGRAELLLHENNPQLAQDIDEERQTRVKEMAYKLNKDDERRSSLSFRGRNGTLDESGQNSPTPDRSRRVSKAVRDEPISLDLKPKASQVDLMMFDMDEEEPPTTGSPLIKPQKSLGATAELEQAPSLGCPWKDVKGKAPMGGEQSHTTQPPSTLQVPSDGALNRADTAAGSPASARGGKPWGSASGSSSKLDLRDIIQSESAKPSALAESLAAHKAREGAPKLLQPKISQKERKKQQQALATQAATLSASSRAPKTAWENSPSDTQAPAWKVASAKIKMPPKKVLPADTPSPSSRSVMKAPHTAETTTSMPINRRTSSPDTRFSGQQRATSNTAIASSRSTPAKTNVPAHGGSGSTPKTPAPTPAESQAAKPLVPHSKVYLPSAPKYEQSLLGYSMADIIGHQRREQELVKEAAAKRSLQEIQEEQAFQEWWDAESRRTQEEEEARRLEREKQKDEGPKKSGGRGRPGKPRGGRGGGEAAAGAAKGRGGGDVAGGSAKNRDGGRDVGTATKGTARGAAKGRGRRQTHPAAPAGIGAGAGGTQS